MSFGSRLRFLRIEKGLNQDDLAKKINLSKANVSKYEANQIEPNFKTLLLLSDLFQVSTDFLLGRSEDIKNTAPVNDADNLIYMSEYTDENIVLISRKNSKSKKYILTDNQITVVESLLSEFRAELPPLPGTLVAEGGEENKTGRRTRKPTL